MCKQRESIRACALPRAVSIYYYYLFLILGEWVKIPRTKVSDACRVSNLSDAPVATAARAAATGRVSMSTPPDPERSGVIEIATRRPLSGIVGPARAHAPTRTVLMHHAVAPFILLYTWYSILLVFLLRIGIWYAAFTGVAARGSCNDLSYE